MCSYNGNGNGAVCGIAVPPSPSQPHESVRYIQGRVLLCVFSYILFAYKGSDSDLYQACQQEVLFAACGRSLCQWKHTKFQEEFAVSN